MIDAIEAEDPGERASAAELYGAGAAADLRAILMSEASPHVAMCRAKAQELS